MSSPDLRPAQYFEFGPEPEGQANNCKNEDRMTDLEKAMFHGSAESSKNIVILVGPTEERFVVNKCLAMLTSGEMEELIIDAPGSDGMLKFPDVHPRDFQLMLEFSILENNWTYTNLKETCRLMESAVLFGFHDFNSAIAKSLLPVIQCRDDVFNHEEVCRALILFQNFDVGDYAFDYILKNASAIFKGNQFLELPWEYLGDILLQDSLKIESEIEVLNALIKWGLNVLTSELKDSSAENLRQVLSSLINCIRFPNIPEKEFTDYVVPLQILSYEQVNIMDHWYKNRDTTIVFNTRTRNYLKTKDPQVASADFRITAEFLHATKMNRLVADFKTNTETHNLGIEIAKLQKQIALMKSFVHETKSFKDAYEADKTCKKLESLVKYFRASETNSAVGDLTENDFQVMRMVVDKIRKNEDFSSLGGDLDEVMNPENIDLQTLESFPKNKLRIEELQKFFKFNVESLMWKIFQKESDSNLVELQKFENTEEFACAIIFKNNTNESLNNLQIGRKECQVYLALPKSMQPFCTHNFGQTSALYDTCGALFYDMGSTRIVLAYAFGKHYHDFGIAIAPLNFTMKEIWTHFDKEDWTNDSTKIKALCKVPQEMEKRIKLGNLYLHAELIGTGAKVILRVMLSAV